MTREEMLARLSSKELTGWMVLFQIQAEEHKRRRDELESGDGQVIEYGLDDDDADVEGPDGTSGL